jgi:serine phosphatase RsbU (regulator of sigma subunit)
MKLRAGTFYFRTCFVFLFVILCSDVFCQSDTTQVEKNIQLARSEFYRNPNASIKFSLKALELAGNSGNKKFIAKAYNSIGSSWYYQGISDSSEKYHTKALDIQIEINDIEGQGRSYTNLGNILSDASLNDRAIKNFLMAEKCFSKVGYNLGLAKLYNSMGVMFYNIKDYVNAIKYFEQGLKISEKLKEDELTYSINSNLANALGYCGRSDEAVKRYQYAYNIAKAKGNFSDLTTICNNISEQYITLNNLEYADQYNKEALFMIRKYKLNDYFKVTALATEGIILQNKGRYKEAIAALDSALKISIAEEDLIKQKEIYRQLSQSLFHMKEYGASYDALEKSIRLTDTIYTKNLDEKLSELNAVHNVEKKEQEIEVLNTQKAAQKKVTLLFIIAGSVSLIAFVIAIYSYSRKKKDNILIQAQKEEVEKKNLIIESKQKEIIDSINYAKRIQYALLAHDTVLNENLGSYFILFRPKDIVSGDFYWTANVERSTLNAERFYLAVCDSTGHGVPGAFMSLLNINFLNEAVNEKNIDETGRIFDHVRERLIENISQEGQQDGMDGILLCINKSTKEITYSAANNVPVLMSDNKLTFLPADKMPVGRGERSGSFSTNRISYKPGDVLYLYTDGFADQFGGPKQKKFKYKQLNDLLLEVSAKDMNEQKEILNKRFEDWKGALEQVDDVCVIGIKL